VRLRLRPSHTSSPTLHARYGDVFSASVRPRSRSTAIPSFSTGEFAPGSASTRPRSAPPTSAAVQPLLLRHRRHPSAPSRSARRGARLARRTLPAGGLTVAAAAKPGRVTFLPEGPSVARVRMRPGEFAPALRLGLQARELVQWLLVFGEDDRACSEIKCAGPARDARGWCLPTPRSSSSLQISFSRFELKLFGTTENECRRVDHFVDRIKVVAKERVMDEHMALLFLLFFHCM